MALIRTHSVEESKDGTYIIVRDTTLLQDYVDNGIDISTDVVSLEFRLTDPDSTVYTYDASSDLASLRDANGLRLTTSDLSYGAEFFVDGVYSSELDLVEDSTGPNTTYTSQSDDIFLAEILQIVASQTKDADWKYLYNPLRNRVSSDLQKRYLVLDIQYAADSGLVSEADLLRQSLVKICS